VYGAESNQAATGPENTGVMLINLPRFRSLFPKLLAFGQGRNFSFEAFDQGWLNAFFKAEMPAGTRAMMNARWNWKVYWGRPCLDKKEMLCHYRSWSNPHIIHFHGPKPGRGDFLKCLASMDQKCLAGLKKIASAHPYCVLAVLIGSQYYYSITIGS
jgi:lipopolysaccharide biosynthesis glycosyltransferase